MVVEFYETKISLSFSMPHLHSLFPFHTQRLGVHPSTHQGRGDLLLQWETKRRRLQFKSWVHNLDQKVDKVLKGWGPTWRRRICNKKKDSRLILVDTYRGWICVWLESLRICDHRLWWISTRAKILRFDLILTFIFKLYVCLYFWSWVGLDMI